MKEYPQNFNKSVQNLGKSIFNNKLHLEVKNILLTLAMTSNANQLQATHTKRQKIVILTLNHSSMSLVNEYIYESSALHRPSILSLQVCSGTDISHFLGK